MNPDQASEEQSAREWKRRYEAAIRASGCIVYDWEPSTDFATFGADVQGLLGYAADELAGGVARWIELLHPDDRALFKEEIARVVATSKPFRLDYRIRRKDGRWLHVEDRGDLIRNDGGTSARMVGFIIDITQRKQAEGALRKERDYSSDIINKTPAIISGCAPDGTTTFLNPWGEHVTGYRSEEIVGKNWWLTFYPGDEYRQVERLFQDFEHEDVRDYEMVLTARNGQKRTICWNSINRRDAAGKICEIIGFGNDVTDQKQAEAALRESEARFSTVFRTSPISCAISRVDDGRFIDVNEAFLTMFGYAREEIVGRTSIEAGLWASPEDRGKFVKILLDKGQARQFEAKFRRKSGAIGDGLMSAEMIDLQGCQHLLVMHLDITERKRIEERLREDHKMKGIGRLAGGMAHKFNNILAAMMMNLNLLQLSGADSESRASLRELEQLSTRAADLVRQLLAFGRQSMMQTKPLDLAALMFEQSGRLRKFLGERISFEFSSADSLPQVQADKEMIEQVVVNLCLNAHDAMPSGGRLRIQLQAEEIDAERAKNHSDAQLGRFVSLSVSDTGEGMGETTLNHLFEPFFTTREVGQGTGLGLAAVHGIIQQHGGWVEVESQVGQGSTFRVFLPAITPSATLLSSRPCTESVHSKGTILLVEDEPMVRKPLHLLLYRWGYQVFEAASGEEALTLWTRHGAEINLLFTDMVMPGGTGLELANQLRQERPGLKVIISSGYHTEQEGLRDTSAAAIVYLPKPCPPATLMSVLRARFDQQ